MDFVHAGLLNISPSDIRRIAFYLVIRIYSSAANSVPTLSTTRPIVLSVKVNTRQVKSYSTVALALQSGCAEHNPHKILIPADPLQSEVGRFS